MSGKVRDLAGEYMSRVGQLLSEALDEEREAIHEAAQLIAESFRREGLLFVFGSGHSHMFAEEAFFRAGGSSRICPILKPPFMLHEGAQASTTLERQSGHAEEILSGYDIHPGKDILLVVSNSGKNAVPVEVAQLASQRGISTLALTSRSYNSIAESDTVTLSQVADIVIDNHCPAGDALISLDESTPDIGPGSTVVGIALLNAILVQAQGILVDAGHPLETLRSAGMPGGIEHNQELIEQVRPRVPHL